MMPNTFKRVLCAVMALVMMVALLPAVTVTAEAADSTVADAAIFFSDLHTSKSNYKQSTINAVFGAVKNTGLPISSVTSCGDAFSVNESSGRYDGDISKLTGYVQNVMGNIPVNYVWSDHDRYAVINGNYMDSNSGFIYGVNDAGAKYYIYELSMADISTNDRYKTGVLSSTEEVQAVISSFKSTVQTLDKTKPLFIASHMPLIDRRDDNGHALLWATAINEVAAEMDVIFLSGHNHSHDEDDDYYIAKGNTVAIASTTNIGTSKDVDLQGIPVTLNFTHLTTGYLAPASTGSAGNSRQGTVIVASITAESIQLTTYDKSGKYTGTYAVDNTVTRAHGKKHNYTISFSGSCTEDGYNIYTCSDCGHSYTGEFVEAPGHNFIPEVIAPNCTDVGYTLYTCEVCGDWYQDEEVDALGHEYVAVVTPPTADNQGYTTYTCKHCYDQYVDDFVNALGHNYEVTVKEPTCTSIGYTTHICKDCGHRYNDNYVSALGHDYHEEVIAPTCTEKGYTLHTCANCADSYKDNYVNALGHSNTKVVTAPTCTEVGYTTFTCADCGNVSTGNYVPEKGHIYNCEESGNLLIFTCKNCSHSYSEVVEPEFTYNKASKLANNNTYVITMYVNKQYYALSHANNRISAVPVTVANNKITSDVTDDLLWTHSSNKLSYKSNGITYLLNASSTRLSISINTGATVSFTSTKLKIGTNYLRFANDAVSLNRTATTTYLFNQVKN